MADTLVLRLNVAGDSASWVVVDADGRLLEQQRSGALRDARAAATGRRLIALVPGGEVVTTRATLPNVSRARQRQMLPFSLEDQFADDIGTLHFAAGPRREDGTLAVSVVAIDKLEAWLERLQAAGLEPAAIYADSDGVPDTPATLNIIAERDTVYSRRPGAAAMSIEGLGLADAVTLIGENTDEADSETPQHALVYLDEQSRNSQAADVEQLSERFSGFDIKALASDALHLFAGTLVNSPGANLLQGRYAPKSNWGALLKPWRIAASLAAGLVAILVLVTAVDYLQLRRIDGALSEAVAARCSEQFSTTALRQCEATVQSRLRDLGMASNGAEEFLATLAAVAQSAGAENQLRQLSYRNSVMDLQLSTPDVPALDAFSRRLDETGQLSVSVQSTNPQQDGTVESRLQIVGGNR